MKYAVKTLLPLTALVVFVVFLSCENPTTPTGGGDSDPLPSLEDLDFTIYPLNLDTTRNYQMIRLEVTSPQENPGEFSYEWTVKNGRLLTDPNTPQEVDSTNYWTYLQMGYGWGVDTTTVIQVKVSRGDETITLEKEFVLVDEIDDENLPQLTHFSSEAFSVATNSTVLLVIQYSGSGQVTPEWHVWEGDIAPAEGGYDYWDNYAFWTTSETVGEQWVSIILSNERYVTSYSMPVQVISAEGMPRLVYPADGEFGLVPENCTLEWNDPDFAGETNTYDLYLSEDSSPELYRSGLTTTSLTPTDLVAFRTYYWKIVAHSDVSETRESTVSLFKTGGPSPEKLQRILPLAFANTWIYQVEDISWWREPYGPTEYDTTYYELTVTVDAISDTANQMDSGIAYHIQPDTTFSPFANAWYGPIKRELYCYQAGSPPMKFKPLQEYPHPIGEVSYPLSEIKEYIIDDKAEITLFDVSYDSCYIYQFRESNWGMTSYWKHITETWFSPGIGMILHIDSSSTTNPDQLNRGYGEIMTTRLQSFSP